MYVFFSLYGHSGAPYSKDERFRKLKRIIIIIKICVKLSLLHGFHPSLIENGMEGKHLQRASGRVSKA